jgi:hypothetical protein
MTNQYYYQLGQPWPDSTEDTSQFTWRLLPDYETMWKPPLRQVGTGSSSPSVEGVNRVMIQIDNFHKEPHNGELGLIFSGWSPSHNGGKIALQQSWQEGRLLTRTWPTDADRAAGDGHNTDSYNADVGAWFGQPKPTWIVSHLRARMHLTRFLTNRLLADCGVDCPPISQTWDNLAGKTVTIEINLRPMIMLTVDVKVYATPAAAAAGGSPVHDHTVIKSDYMMSSLGLPENGYVMNCGINPSVTEGHQYYRQLTADSSVTWFFG